MTEERISDLISASPPFEPQIVSNQIGAVIPDLPVPPPPFFTALFMDVKPKLVHNVQVSWSILPWETGLKGILDVEVSCTLPSFMGKILSNLDLAGIEVLRDTTKSFTALPFSKVTLRFPWKVKGLDLVRSIWGWLTTGTVLVRCWGNLSEFIFTKKFTIEAWVPVR